MDNIAYRAVKQLAFLTALPFLFGGCNDIYSQFCTPEKVEINCLKFESLDDEVSEMMQTAFSEVPHTKNCPFILQGMHHHVDACQNPVANSVGSDFDGYVKLQIFYKGTCYYRIQTDYKGRGWQPHLEEISERLKDELNI